MGQTYEKRGREQRKRDRRNEKEVRKKLRRERESAQPVADVVDPSYFMPTTFEDERKPN
jgi:hypothetical protein